MFRRMKSRRLLPRRRRANAAVVALVIVAATLVAPIGSVGAYSGSVESANARYVVATYRQLLGRDPGDGGLDFYLGRIAAGGDRSRQEMARALLFSPEGSANEVRRAYRTILGRDPETKGGEYWTSQLQSQDVLDLRLLLMSSNEYVRLSGGTHRSWVRALYRDVLEREAEPQGLAYWTDLADQGIERPYIVAGFYLGRESLGNRTDAYYRLALSRPASGEERQAGAAAIAVEGERSFYAGLWASDEVFESYFDLSWE